MQIVEITKSNDPQGTHGVYSTQPGVYGPYDTALLFRGSLEACRTWARENEDLVTRKRRAYLEW